ncbi:hypothetical protein O6H91_Y460900 [Diphasiastrum complanatum]|nr:hypothetical protein O6H91_Y460900 [Diphasiastrum complanatum]KAJ7298730.1 hypothetical protein O6H91_Y460900 [Diphasiastrum complanatum]
MEESLKIRVQRRVVYRSRKELWALLLGVTSLCICVIFVNNLASIVSRVDSPSEFVDKEEDLRRQAAICDQTLYPAAWELKADQITILVNGFAEARLPLLQASMQKYSASPEVHSIFILWGNVSTPRSVLQSATFVSVGSPIYVVRQDSTSLNDRFLPRPYIKTRAVMVCDDDITIELEDLKFALQAWSENQRRIVGFFPRTHSYNLNTKSWIYTKSATRYSIMLTKLMIIATEFLYLYTCKMPPGVKEYVDEGMNCEDIAMNFLVSSYGGQGPLFVAGKPQDWGDTRSSANDLNTMGLSARVGHRKDRGDCIGAFQRLWGSMELRYSSIKAIPDVEEQVLCDKFGVLIHCDAIVFSRREALRIAGKQIIASKALFAYVTILPSCNLLNASFVLAQSLRSTGTVHDLVALLHPSANISDEHPLLQEHFDVVRQIQWRHESRLFRKGIEKLTLWLLSEYTKVVYVDVEALVISNLDHLFELSDFAAGSQMLNPQYFDSGFLVLRPSIATYKAMIDTLEKANISHLLTADHFLNAFFNSWLEMPTNYRLPMCYTAVLHHISESEYPPGFDRKFFDQKLGNLAVIRLPNLTFALAAIDPLQQACTHIWCNVWIQVFEALVRNSFQPYENESLPVSQVYPANLTLPEISISRSATDSTLEQGQSQLEAFATVIYENNTFCLEGWLVSFQEYHFLSRSVDTLLIVVSTVDEQLWKSYAELFDNVVVVDPVALNGDIIHSSFALLYLWNQTSYARLVYVDLCSIFLKSCNALLDYYTPLAAIPNILLPDTFSTEVVVLQPNKLTYQSLSEGLKTYKVLDQSFESYANFYYRDWHTWPAKHRLVPSFRIDMRFHTQLFEQIEHSTKLLVFSSNPPIWSSSTNWTPLEKLKVKKRWKRTLCSKKYAIQAGPGNVTKICNNLE